MAAPRAAQTAASLVCEMAERTASELAGETDASRAAQTAAC